MIKISADIQQVEDNIQSQLRIEEILPEEWKEGNPMPTDANELGYGFTLLALLGAFIEGDLQLNDAQAQIVNERKLTFYNKHRSTKDGIREENRALRNKEV